MIVNNKEKETVLNLIEKPLLDQGFDIADITLSKFKKNSTLRVFVYSEKKVTIDNCTLISRLIGDLIDGTDLFKSGYSLEVSSPGLERPLRTFKDFQYRAGERVNIEFTDTSRNVETAEIISAIDDKVTFKNESGQFTLDLVEIKQAKIIF